MSEATSGSGRPACRYAHAGYALHRLSACRRRHRLRNRSFMRIVDIRETSVPLGSDLANSSFDFTEMTTSIVAVVTDVVRGGRPVAGFAFNSTGRYACGAQMRERFIPRVLRADPASLLDDAGDIDPARVLAAMCRREKIGG